MDHKEIQDILTLQKQYFHDGNTLSYAMRKDALESLENTVRKNEDQIFDVLYEDLGKDRTESYMCELGMVYSELGHMKRHMKKYMKKRRVHTPLAQAVSRSYVLPSPKGTVLIMSPWNYPLLLALDPLIDAISAGNTAIIKPSAYAPASASLIRSLISEALPRELAYVVTGGREENKSLLSLDFDHIFFTGSKKVGKEVLRSAAEKLIPVTLELGGKSPCIVEKSADIGTAARRIVFGKLLNCGQTCVAPDYICCDRSILDELEKALISEIRRQYGEDDHGRIINLKHFDRLLSLIEKSNITYGGGYDRDSLCIKPAISCPCTWDDILMEDEIFGPLLPVIPYDDIDLVIENIKMRPSPLALYLFTKDRKVKEKVLSSVSFGGGCINDTVIHLATTEMGFGGTGESGMGAYHGRAGFDTFSHMKSIVDKHIRPDTGIRYRPYTGSSEKLARIFMR